MKNVNDPVTADNQEVVYMNTSDAQQHYQTMCKENTNSFFFTSFTAILGLSCQHLDGVDI